MSLKSEPVPDHKTRCAVITKAFINASTLLEITTAEISQITGVSQATWSRVCQKTRLIDVDSKEGEMAILFLRVFRSIDALLGGNDAASRDWLRSENYHLEGIPIELMQSIDGLMRVVTYLDAMRGRN
jgi:uncharacterized protein (DUF2384 family)